MSALRYDDSLVFAEKMWSLLISGPKISRASGYVHKTDSSWRRFRAAFVTDISNSFFGIPRAPPLFLFFCLLYDRRNDRLSECLRRSAEDCFRAGSHGNQSGTPPGGKFSSQLDPITYHQGDLSCRQLYRPRIGS